MHTSSTKHVNCNRVKPRRTLPFKQKKTKAKTNPQTWKERKKSSWNIQPYFIISTHKGNVMRLCVLIVCVLVRSGGGLTGTLASVWKETSNTNLKIHNKTRENFILLHI